MNKTKSKIVPKKDIKTMLKQSSDNFKKQLITKKVTDNGKAN